MVVLEENNEASALAVEAGRNVEDDLLCDFNDGLVGDGRLVVERIDGTSVCDNVEEGLRFGHLG